MGKSEYKDAITTPTKASTLIQRAKERAEQGAIVLPKQLKAELIEIIKHNTTCRQTERVLLEDVYKLGAVWGVKLSRTIWSKIRKQLEQEIAGGK